MAKAFTKNPLLLPCGCIPQQEMAALAQRISHLNLALSIKQTVPLHLPATPGSCWVGGLLKREAQGCCPADLVVPSTSHHIHTGKLLFPVVKSDLGQTQVADLDQGGLSLSEGIPVLADSGTAGQKERRLCTKEPGCEVKSDRVWVDPTPLHVGHAQWASSFSESVSCLQYKGTGAHLPGLCCIQGSEAPAPLGPFYYHCRPQQSKVIFSE